MPLDTGPVSADARDEGGGTIVRRAGIVAAGGMTSRALGLARDMVFAAVFPTAATDLFYVAFTIPNALRVLLGEGAVSSAVIPVFAEVRAQRGDEEARRYFAKMFGLLLVVLALVSVVGVLAAPALVSLYASGYLDDPVRFDETVGLTRIVFPYIFFIGLAALGMGGLNALRRFAVPAFAPALLNVALIAAAFLLVAPMTALGYTAIAALAVGALAGGALQWVAQWPAQRAAGLLRLPRIDLSDPGVRKTLTLMVPMLAGFGVYQVNTMIGRSLLTFLPHGSQSYIWYGQRLVEVPQGMFALAIASAALPTLADLRAAGDDAKVREVFGSALRLTLFLTIPATVGLVVLAEPIAAVMFGRGAFSRADVLATAASLRWQAAGIWAISSVRAVLPMFLAYHDTKSPVLASATNLVIFAPLAYFLMQSFDHVGVAMALSLAGVAQLAMLLALLRRKVGRLGLRAVAIGALRACGAAAAMGGAAYAVSTSGEWSRGGNDPRNIAVLVGTIATGAVVYFVVARLLRAPELDDVVKSLRRRLAR